MGLDTTHGCWHGAYSAFHRWRTEIAKLAGIPIALMEGFYDPQKHQFALDKLGTAGDFDRCVIEQLLDAAPILWESLKPSPLHILLNHSDCDGEIAWEACDSIANELTYLLPLLPKGGGGSGHIGDWREKTQQFIDGLRAAHAAKENVEFH